MEQPLPAPDSDLYRSYRLQPDETLLNVCDVKITLPTRPLSTIEAMLALTGYVKHPKDIGTNGPALAAAALETDKNNPDLNHYNHVFPRDAHVIAYFNFEHHPLLTAATVDVSLANMGILDNYDDPQGLFDEQEIGKIPHELLDPNHLTAIDLSERKKWGWPYYGAIDTTGKNIMAIHRLVGHKDFGVKYLDEPYLGRDKQTHTILHGLEQNIAWLTGRMDRNPEGLVECLDKNPFHHANQAWTDSPEAFHHADGSWAEHHPELDLGVAAVEVQGETYDALRGAAEIFEKLGRFDEASSLHERAGRLRSVVLDKFWVRDNNHFGGYFARGTDRNAEGQLRPLKIRSSDMGHLLNSGILDEVDDPTLNEEIKYKREAVIQNLFTKEMLCPSGIRTLSSDSVRYSDERYHNGTTWFWVSLFIAKGLDQHGLHGLSYLIKECAWQYYKDTHLLSEYGSGSPDPTKRVITRKIEVRNDTLLSEKKYHISRPGTPRQGWTAAPIYALKREYAAVTAAKLTRDRKLGNLYLAAAEKGYMMAAVKDEQIEFENTILKNIR